MGQDTGRNDKARDNRLDALETRLKVALEEGPDRRARQGAEKRERSRSEGIAWRVSTELVASFLVCGLVGWWVDEWADTRPFALIVGLLLGGVVGIRNVYRVARDMTRDAEGKEDT
ncbi:MAG: AtpZ/AtpI family protein [Pseudomonadota bacterium]|nr:AtpZ/AtpI family protein [Pseudomonadota bacterium]